MCAEASFINLQNGDTEKFVLKIEMNMKNNYHIFKEIKDYMGVGKLSTYTRRDKEIQRYTVRSIPRNISVVCPIMERSKIPVNTWRGRQYEEWKSDMLMYIKNHYSQECYELSTKVIKNAR